MTDKRKFYAETIVAACSVITIWVNAFQGNWATAAWAATALLWVNMHVQTEKLNARFREETDITVGRLQRWVRDAKLTDAMRYKRIAHALREEIVLQGTEDFIILKNDEVREWWFEKEAEDAA